MTLPLDIAWEAISKLPTEVKIDLVKSHINIPEEFEFSISPVDSNDKLKFDYYGKSIQISLRLILENLLDFRNNLLTRMMDAKVDRDRLEIVFSEPDSKENMVMIQEVILEAVSKAEDEDTLAEIFDRDFSAFKVFYDSPDRRSLDEYSRSFLQDIIKSPFDPIWTKPI